MDNAYDSTKDTKHHSARVRDLLLVIIDDLTARGANHDASKLSDPELAIFNEYTPKLKTTTYGSEEYKGYLDAMGKGLAHHYACNRHHPEHFEGGIDEMSLVDVLEMLMDWKAATERHDDGDIRKSIELNASRFGISPQLVSILHNTIDEYNL